MIRLFAILVAASLMTPALAGSTKFYSVWQVEPPQPSAEELTLKSGDFVQKARLLPPGLVVVDDPVTDPKTNKTLVEAGEQLFQVSEGQVWRKKDTAGDGLGVYCHIKPKRFKKGVLDVLLGPEDSTYRQCFVDVNRDGVFDGFFGSRCGFIPFPLISGKVPADLLPIKGGSYRRLASTDIKDGPMVGIIFRGIAPIDGKPKFGSVFGGGEPINSFGGFGGPKKEPGQKSEFGALFTVIDKGQGTIRIRIDSGIPAQPFAMFSTGGGC